MAERKDYYKILGITDEEKKLKGKEFEKVLKSKYKKLVIQYHPDRVKDETKKREAEVKFKEITEANAVLSDAKKREEYDNAPNGFDFSGFSGFGNAFNMDDIFSHFGNNFGFNPFGRGHNSSTKNERTQKGSSVRAKFENVSLEDLYNGVTKKIKLNVLRPCKTCNGTSSKDGNVKECDTCYGQGQVFKTMQTEMGVTQIFTTCPKCHGRKTIIANPCGDCTDGVTKQVEEVTIDIPKGFSEGMVYIVNGKGNSPLLGKGANGDLEVIITEEPHPVFKRVDDDLYFNIELSLVDAILGCEKTIKTISGKEIKYTIAQGIEDGTQIRFANYGMPHCQSNGYGNMFGTVKIKMPKQLTDEEKAIVESLRDKPHFS